MSAQTKADTAVTVQLSCSDPAGVAVTYALGSMPTHGTLSGFDPTQGTVTYTPAPGYSGADAFTYDASSSNSTASPQTFSITISAPPMQPVITQAHRAPAIASARLTNSRFRVTAHPTVIAGRRVPLGTSLRFTLSTLARLVITFTSSVPGLRHRGRCASRTSRLARAHATRCTRSVLVGRLIRASEGQGPDEVAFQRAHRQARSGARCLPPDPSGVRRGWSLGLDEKPRDFYGRQLKDWKGSAETEQMVPLGMAAYGRLCGWTLARAHAHSGDRIAIAAYLGNSDSFDRAILEFSKAYAEQNERDYQELSAAVSAGRITAESGL